MAAGWILAQVHRGARFGDIQIACTELAQYQQILDYFNLEDGGTLCVNNVKDKGDIQKSPALQEAFELGRKM